MRAQHCEHLPSELQCGRSAHSAALLQSIHNLRHGVGAFGAESASAIALCRGRHHVMCEIHLVSSVGCFHARPHKTDLTPLSETPQADAISICLAPVDLIVLINAALSNDNFVAERLTICSIFVAHRQFPGS